MAFPGRAPRLTKPDRILSVFPIRRRRCVHSDEMTGALSSFHKTERIVCDGQLFRQDFSSSSRPVDGNVTELGQATVPLYWRRSLNIECVNEISVVINIGEAFTTLGNGYFYCWCGNEIYYY